MEVNDAVMVRRIQSLQDSRDPEKNPISFGCGTNRDGHLDSWKERARRGIAHETYIWHDDTVISIDVEYAPIDENGAYGTLVLLNKFDAKYDRIGNLEEILCHWPRRANNPMESAEVVYRGGRRRG